MARVAQHKIDHRKFYLVCRCCDFVITLVAVLVLFVAALAVLYKTIWLTSSGESPPLPGTEPDQTSSSSPAN